MAQFKSQTREGSFKANQIQTPDEVKKLQNAANRRLQGMSAAQAELEKTRRVFLRAQEVANKLTNEGGRVASEVRRGNYQAQKDGYEKDLTELVRRNEVKNKEKANKYKLLESFSKTAFNLTKGIIDENRENWLKAMNQVAVTNGIDYDILNKVSQLSSEMTQAEYQRTDVVKQWLEEGKSQEFIDATYHHLLKGGGYTNYIENAFVLKQQALKESSAYQALIGDDSLTPEEKLLEAERIRTDLVAGVKVNGKTPRPEFLAENYLPAINAAHKEAIRAINGEIRADVAEKNLNTRIQILTNAYLGDGTTKDPKALLQIFSQNNPTAAKRVEMTQIAVNAGTLEDNIKLANTKFEGPNGTLITLMDYPDSAAILNREIRAKQRERRQKVDDQARLEREVMDEEIRAKIQEAYGDADSLTEQELEGIKLWALNRYGVLEQESKVIEQAAKFTIEQRAIPEMEEALKEYVATGNASLNGLENFGPMPISLKNRYTDIINKQARIRNSKEYQDSLKVFEKTIKGEINKFATYVAGGFNSADVQWYFQKQRESFIEKVTAYSEVKTEAEAIRLAQAEVVTNIAAELGAPGAVTIKGGITEYRDLLAQDRVKIAQARQQYNQLYEDYTGKDGKKYPGFVASPEGRTPQGWVEFLGNEVFIEATEQLQKGEPSVFFEQLGQKLNPRNPMAPWEAQAWIAPAINGMEAIEPPASFEAIKERLTSTQRQTLFGSQSAIQDRIRVLQEQLEDYNKPTRISFRGEQPTQTRWQNLAIEAGFNPEEARIMAAIVMAESGGNATIDTVQSGLDPNKTNEYSIGGPQINVLVHQEKLAARGFTEEDMRDPLKAMIIARDVYVSQGFGAWTTYNKGLHNAFFSQAPAQDDGLVRHKRGGLTYIDNVEAYRSAGNAFQDAGFRVAEHSDFDQVDNVHTEDSYHYHDEGFDITDWTGGDAPGAREASIAKTGRLQRLIESLDLFVEVIGPLSGRTDHATHLHLGGLKRPMTEEDIRLIKSLK